MVKIETPDTKEMNSKALMLADKANRLVITNDEEYQAAANELRSIKSFLQQVDKEFEESSDLAYRTWKAITELKKRVRAPGELAEANYKKVISGYLMAEEAKRKAEQERILKEARAKAEEEAAAARKLQEDQRLQMAADHESRGDTETAQAIIDAPIHVAPVVAKVSQIVPQQAKAAGVSGRKEWKHRIIDSKLVPCDFHEISEKKIKDFILEC